ISLKGVMPLSETLDHLGILCEDLSGIDPLMHVLDDGWSSDTALKGEGNPVLGVPDGPYLNLATPHGLKYFEMTVESLIKKGFEIKRITTLSNIDEINDNHLNLMHAEIARSHASWYEQYGNLYSTKMSEGFKKGSMIDNEGIEKLKKETIKFRMKVEEEMKSEGIDAWICPPTMDSADEGLSSTGSPIMNFSWTHGGLPCLSLPSIKDEAGMPHGIQLVGYFMKDEELVASVQGLYDTLNEG
ncbi:MAG: amidase, partial [Desulfobacterales bacterium]|nr:amidase [Desulfobacterales bacterium]